ncbi:MAG: TIGR04282 family arsenosugar biosynthesis glycosyltransferase [Actinomycetota bacterium]
MEKISTNGRPETLIIFTRYPEPGKTKTRLIPMLGAEGAALLHRRLTEKTLVTVKEIQAARSLSVAVYFNGGNQQLMQNWLGTEITYQPQVEGDLGAKMAAAFQNCFQAGSEKVAIIGTDCPSLNVGILTQAFEALSEQELILGPAADGGYYLIGLRRLIPDLFRGIRWGTASVLTETQAIAQVLNLAVAYLPILADVDRPEDLLSLGAEAMTENLSF